MTTDITKLVHPATQYLNRLQHEVVRFADMNPYQQKALVVYMIEGAWAELARCAEVGLTPKNIETWRQRAVEQFGDLKFGVGILKMDDDLKVAVVSTIECYAEENGVEAFDRLYSKPEGYRSSQFIYNEPWPVIVDDAESAPEWGFLQDGWSRFWEYWAAKDATEIPFIRFLPDWNNTDGTGRGGQ